MLAALALAQAAWPAEPTTFRDVPSFAFACRPTDTASALPTYEYRVFLPVKPGPSQMPVRVELTKMEGVSKGMTSLSLNRGLLWVFRGPGASDDSPPLFKVNAFSGSLENDYYDFQMIFTRSVSTDQNGASTASISPSEGRLRIKRAGVEQNFRGECTHIDMGSVQ